MDIVTCISHSNFNSKHDDKCKFTFTFIPLVTTCNLFPLEVVQKYQHCQLCVLRENSIVSFFGPDMACFSVSSGVTCWGIKGEIIPTLLGGEERSYLVAAKRFWQLDPLIFGPVPPFLIHATCRSSLGRKRLVEQTKQFQYLVHILFLETPLLISAKNPINSTVVISKNYRINRVIYS